MNRAELLALAERCEKATGPDRALDSGIAAALGWPDVQFTGQARAYTTSLDAALTLVPEWHGWALKTKMDGAEYSCSCWRFRTGMGPLTYAATPALALCAAALRARAAKEGA